MSATQTQITIPSNILTFSELSSYVRTNSILSQGLRRGPLSGEVKALTANIEARLAEMKENLDEIALTQIMIQINASARQGTPLFTTKKVFKMIERIAFSGWYCFRKDGFRRTQKSTFLSPYYSEFTLADGRVWGTEATYRRVMESELYLVVSEILKNGGPIGAEPEGRDRDWSPNAKLSRKIEKAILKSEMDAKILISQKKREEEARQIEEAPAPVEEAPEALPLDLGEDIDEALAVDRLHFEDIRRETITMILGRDTRVVEYIFPSSQIKNGLVREFFVLEGSSVGNSTLVLLTEALSAHPSFVEAKLKTTSEGKQVLMIVSKAVREFLGMKRHEKLQSETAPSTPAPETEALIEEVSEPVRVSEGVKVQFHRADLKGLSFTTEGIAERDVQGLFYRVPFDRSSGLLSNWSVSPARPLVEEEGAPLSYLPLVFDWSLFPSEVEGQVKAEDLLETFLDRFEVQFGFRPAVELPPEEGLVLLPETIKLFVPIKPSRDENLVRHLRRRVLGVSQASSISVRSEIFRFVGKTFTGFDIEVPVGTDLDELGTALLDLTRRAQAPETAKKPEGSLLDDLVGYTRRAQAPEAETAPETAPSTPAPETPKLWSEEEAQEGDTHQAHLDGVLVFSDDLSSDEIEGGEVVLVEIHQGGFVESHGVFESESVALGFLEVGEESIRGSSGSVFKTLPLVQLDR